MTYQNIRIATLNTGLFLTIVFLSVARDDSKPGSFPEWDAKQLTQTKMCQICHGKADIGNQFAAWEKSPHANAYHTLTTDKAKEVAAKMGVANPQESGKCLKCHATAYGFSEQKLTSVIQVEAGVTCQSCHGPGKNYMAKSKHAENRETAMKHGMIFPTEANTCSRCHNPSNPTHNPERYTKADGAKVDFDYQQAFEKIKHPVKK